MGAAVALTIGILLIGGASLGVVFSGKITEWQRPNRSLFYHPSQSSIVALFVVAIGVGAICVLAALFGR